MDQKILKKIDGKIDALQKRVDNVDEHLNSFEDKAILKFIDLDEHLKWLRETKASKDDFRTIINILDGHTTILLRLDQERLFAHERTNRIEANVERLNKKVGLV